MHVLVTGAAGFIGFHLSRRLTADGHTVVGIDNLNDYYDVRLKEDRLAQLAECRITAPNSGRLVELPCKYTRYVQKGVVAARLSSGGAIRGIAYVDESVVRKVRPGQVVRISSGVFNRLEYGIFYGEVTRIYDTPVQEPSTNMTRYPVELSIDPQGRPLRLGSSAEFAIVTGHEPVIYTILNLTRHDEYDNPEPQTPRRAK